ncbi:hypothetical protein D9757_014963 [Collybiopsis confluens]|uniref:DUF6532 domain-containing protein n=1 Tax=Collybiopsis confluens TaxID=2823264 RepID=A0A8H5CPS0_9AGAR|nr:hypothetical protein D9757_014963 [Collybiopsis confluens]
MPFSVTILTVLDRVNRFELDHNPFTLTLPDTATNFSLIREIASLQSARFSQVSLYKPHEHYGAGESEKLRQKLLESKTPAELGMLLDSTETPLLPILKSLPHARSATITALIAVIWSPDQMVDLKRKLDDVDSGPDDMHEMAKKKFHALVNDPTSSPSVSAQPTNYYQYQTRPTALVDGRYSNDASKVAAAPIEFFHPVFAAFLGYLKDNERIDPELLRNTHEMMHSASQIATAEHQRERKTQAHLAKILNKGVGQISVYNKGTPDHSVTFTCEGFPLGVALLAALEEKGELGTSGDPVTQVAFSYLTYWKCFGQTELRNACCCPSFLISLAGPWITISGAIFAESVVVQRLTDLICLENGRDQDDEKVFAVARVFRALVWAVSDLKDWYINHRADLTPGTRSLSLPEERFFPLANSYTAADGITVSFKYLNWLKAPSPTCRVFLAVRSDNEEKVVVKFVERYGEIAHKQLAKAGLAPKLLYCGSIWKETTQQLGMGKRKMVVMEYIEGKHPHGGVSDSVRDAIANTIQGLHQNGLVHGDIRLPNIIIQDSDQSNPNLDEAKRVRILDFDWAGKDGEVRYPLGLVMDGRPVDAVEDLPICTFRVTLRHPEARKKIDPQLWMNIDDVTTPVAATNSRRVRARKTKILETDFPDPRLPRFAKRCTRMATCILDLFPTDRMFSWQLFSDELQKIISDGLGDDLSEALLAVSRNSLLRTNLVTYMNYGSSSVRWDVAMHIRIRVGQYFDIPGNKSEDQIVMSSFAILSLLFAHEFCPHSLLQIKTVNWLLQGPKYNHSDIDIVAQTTDGLPFLSPLISQILRGYFIEANPKQDQITIDHLREQRKIPIPLIAMISSMIGHALSEYATGSRTKSDIPLTAKNLGPSYRAAVDCLKLIRQDAPEYLQLIQRRLFNEMMFTGSSAIPIQPFDPARLNAYARAQNDTASDVATALNTGSEDGTAALNTGSEDGASILNAASSGAGKGDGSL